MNEGRRTLNSEWILVNGDEFFVGIGFIVKLIKVA